MMRAFAAGIVVAALLTAAPVRAQTGAAPDFSNIEIHSLHSHGCMHFFDTVTSVWYDLYRDPRCLSFAVIDLL